MTVQINNEDLQKWFAEKDMNISKKEIEVIFLTLDREGNFLQRENDKFYLCSVDQNGSNEIEISQDELLDIVCEFNYKIFSNLRNELMTSDMKISTMCQQTIDFLNLELEKEYLSRAFSQTIYAKKNKELVAQIIQKPETNRMKRKSI